jgi:hypothetical protein
VVIRRGVAGDWHGHLGWGIIAIRSAAREEVGFVIHVGNFPPHWPADTAADTSPDRTSIFGSQACPLH